MKLSRLSEIRPLSDSAGTGEKSVAWLAIGLSKAADAETGIGKAHAFDFARGFIPVWDDAPTAVGETLAVYPPAGSGLPPILFYGLGETANPSPRDAFEAATAASKKLASKPGRSVQVVVPERVDIEAFVRGWVVGTVGPGLRKKEVARHAFDELVFVDPLGRSNDETLRKADRIGHYTNLARTLGNTTPEEKYPERFARLAEKVAQSAGCTVEIWDEKKIGEERFGGLLGVAAGSDRPPRFVILSWNGAPADPSHVALVGKGVTFDSGGLSLKPSASMEDMKSDMTGAAVVLATIATLAELKAPVNVIGYLPMTENMTGGLATKLGDVLTMRDGTTVEILNTDAEGRLILADALAYAVERKPKTVVNLATLTGACMVALGTKIAGLFSNDDSLAAQLVENANVSGERLWRLPIDADFKDQLKSTVSDLKNVGSRWGGAITAAKFLEHFVGETPWAHLDIAGPSFADSETATRDAGGTGCYVATLTNWLIRG
jgi:leucyl aminopeptidase